MSPIINRCNDVFVFVTVLCVFISAGTGDSPAPPVDVVVGVKVLKRRAETFDVGISLAVFESTEFQIRLVGKRFSRSGG